MSSVHVTVWERPALQTVLAMGDVAYKPAETETVNSSVARQIETRYLANMSTQLQWNVFPKIAPRDLELYNFPDFKCYCYRRYVCRHQSSIETVKRGRTEW